MVSDKIEGEMWTRRARVPAPATHVTLASRVRHTRHSLSTIMITHLTLIVRKVVKRMIMIRLRLERQDATSDRYASYNLKL